MKIKFNKTGTHIRKGKLLVRLDLYPDPTYKTYALQNIKVFARALTEAEEERVDGVLTEKAKALRELVPTKEQLNPFLCHFISIDPSMTKRQLSDYIKNIFNKKTLTRLDDILSANNRKDELHSVLRNKLGNRVLPVEESEMTVKIINDRFANIEVNI